jgi:hypothetical protein
MMTHEGQMPNCVGREVLGAMSSTLYLTKLTQGIWGLWVVLMLHLVLWVD